MEWPPPSPALMLPALDLSSAPDLSHHISYKKREAQWKKLVSETHKHWCLCGSYKNHFLPPDTPLINSSSCGGVQDGDKKEDAADPGTEEDFIAGIDGDGEEKEL